MKSKKEKIIPYCSRCGIEWCLLGRVVKYGKHYPAYTIKYKNGTTEERPADDEIKEALCRECAKETYDNLRQQDKERLIRRLEEINKRKRDSMAEPPEKNENFIFGYQDALDDIIKIIKEE